MSDITRKKINNNEYEFINDSYGNRSGFVHTTEIFKNDRRVAAAKSQYINRTWECYRYQSVMKKAVYSLLEEAMENAKQQYKVNTGKCRITKKALEIIEAALKEDPNYQELQQLYETL